MTGLRNWDAACDMLARGVKLAAVYALYTTPARGPTVGTVSDAIETARPPARKEGKAA